MAMFDRFDICEAHAVLEWDYNRGGWLHERPSNRRRLEATSVQLHRIGFKAKLDLSYDTLTEEGKEIYLDNVLRLKLPCDEEQKARIKDMFVHDWLLEQYPHIFQQVPSH
jgi:hypothetical protein